MLGLQVCAITADPGDFIYLFTFFLLCFTYLLCFSIKAGLELRM